MDCVEGERERDTKEKLIDCKRMSADVVDLFFKGVGAWKASSVREKKTQKRN